MATKQNAQQIQKVCVIGAGVMGAGIAAQVANSGTEVLLLDIVPKDAGTDKKSRNQVAAQAIENLKKQNPAPLMNGAAATRISVGNIEDDLKLAGQCDWVIEAIIENPAIKQKLYADLERYRLKDTVVTSNTSTIPLADLTAKMKKNQKAHFFISHFFNPPRYMRLLEFITNDETAPNVVEKIRTFADYSLGKTVVTCHDRPGFIANRIGTYWLHCAVVEAMAQGIDIETADAVLSKPFGFPKTGVFALMDMVGLDLMPHVLENLRSSLEKTDTFMELGEPPQFIYKMIEDGYTGRKGKGGFYRLKKDKNQDGKKQALSLTEQTYSDAQRPKIPAANAGKKGGMKAVVQHDSPAGKYAWTVVSKTLAYAASLVPEVADDIATVDTAMRLGYNWKYGPFEMLDKFGTGWFSAALNGEQRQQPILLTIANGQSFYRTHNGQKQYLGLDGSYHDLIRPEGILSLEDIKRTRKPLARNRSASIWDVGDHVACLEFHSKMNALNPLTMLMINKARKLVPAQGFKALVLYNEGENYSVGANIGLLGIAAKLRFWPFVDWFLNNGQKSFMGLKYAPFPVVGAPSGMALGGGCESLLHCDAIEAHAETYTGLVEAGVGIIPGWGGCKELLLRAAEREKEAIKPLKGWVTPNFIPGGPMKPILKVFPLIAMADVAKSAYLAREKMFFRETDAIVMNRDRLLANAKNRALELAENYTPPAPATLRLPGPSGAAALKLGIADFVKKGAASTHDGKIGQTLATVLSGGHVTHQQDISEQHVLDLEREGLIAMAKTPKSRARVMHMLKTGKPLRN